MTVPVTEDTDARQLLPHPVGPQHVDPASDAYEGATAEPADSSEAIIPEPRSSEEDSEALLETPVEAAASDGVVGDQRGKAETEGPQVALRALINRGTMIGQLIEAVQRHSGAPIPPRWIALALKNYLDFENQADAEKLLLERRVLVLVADRPGSGRWTAALRLLSMVEKGGLTLRRIRREAGDGFNVEGLGRQRKAGWILDLRDEDEKLPAGCDLALELQHVEALCNDGSYLVVLINSRLWQQHGHGATDLALTPRSPNGPELFVRSLAAAGIPWAAELAKELRFSEELPSLLPGQIASWANTVTDTAAEVERRTGREIVAGSDDFKEVVTVAGNAVGDWAEQLAAWHSRAGRTSFERNYLLLMAVRDGVPLPDVHRRTASLAKAFKEKGENAEPLAGQQGPGLIQLAREIDAVSLPDGRLRFAGPGYAEAVVRYFWRDRPHLIDAFTTWTANLCADLKDKADGALLAERMAPWVLHHVQATRSTRLLRRVVSDWSEHDNLAPHAQTLMATAALDSLVGQLTRNAIDAWIANVDTPAKLLCTLALVCQNLAPTNPEGMLRRLGNLARSTSSGVPEVVGEAITALWSDEELRPGLQNTVIKWFDSDQEPLRRAAANAFLNLALQLADGVPVLLEPRAPAADWVVTGWRVSLEVDEPSALVHRAAYAWLDAAARSDQETCEQVMGTLVDAVHNVPVTSLRGQRHLSLFRLSEHWTIKGTALDETARRQLRTRLQTRAQDADPHRPDFGRWQQEAEGA